MASASKATGGTGVMAWHQLAYQRKMAAAKAAKWHQPAAKISSESENTKTMAAKSGISSKIIGSMAAKWRKQRKWHQCSGGWRSGSEISAMKWRRGGVAAAKGKHQLWLA